MHEKTVSDCYKRIMKDHTFVILSLFLHTLSILNNVLRLNFFHWNNYIETEFSSSNPLHNLNGNIFWICEVYYELMSFCKLKRLWAFHFLQNFHQYITQNSIKLYRNKPFCTQNNIKKTSNGPLSLQMSGSNLAEKIVKENISIYK